MPGATTRGYPYPLGGDPIDVANDIRRLAEAIDLDVVKAVSVDLMVPARAEIVIEGFIDTDPEKVQHEGPFGEYPLYYTGSGPQPYIQVTAVTTRRDPIYVDVFNSHDEHLVLGAVPRMGSIYRRVKAVVPSVTAVNLPLGRPTETSRRAATAPLLLP